MKYHNQKIFATSIKVHNFFPNVFSRVVLSKRFSQSISHCDSLQKTELRAEGEIESINQQPGTRNKAAE
jgi:hypothetical protein